MKLTETHPGGRWVLIAIVIAAISLAAALIGGSSARGDAAACGGSPCVVLIEVNGLTPQDVTPEKTPFLWALAHPDQPNGAGIPSAALSAIGGQEAGPRAGWIWQAPRGVMSSSKAAGTASLLTGADAEGTDVPGDTFRDPDDGKWKTLSASPEASGGSDDPQAVQSNGQTILALVQENAVGGEGGGGTAAKAYVGDPALFDLATDGVDDCAADSPQEPTTVAGWRPGHSGESAPPCARDVSIQAQGADPALCPVPRLEPPEEESNPADVACPADDMQTMNAAAQDIGTQAASRLRLSYIHLAELGIVKQRGGNVPAALTDLDAAVAEYAGRYAQQDAEKWDRTVLVVVGNHGYEPTPQPLRVPGNDSNDPAQSLGEYIEDEAVKADGRVEVVAQGSLATVYYTGAPAGRESALKAVRDNVLALNESVDRCAPQETANLGPCVDEVLYTANPPAGETANTVKEKHPTWHIGDAGDLVVMTGRGWAAAPVVDVETENGLPDPSGDNNPWSASNGGPRNRAVAALVHGSAELVNQFPWVPTDDGSDGRHPVTASEATGEPGVQQPKHSSEPGSPAVEKANADPGDDATATGHEQQPMTIDFMPTIAAMLKITVPPEQPDGDIIQHPWKTKLAAFVIEEDLGEPEPEPPPIIIEEPPVVIQPPVGPIFTFDGLIQKLSAQVGTVVERKVGGKRTQVFVPAGKAKRGTLLRHLNLKADFGKPLAQVTLTLYRRAAKTRKSAKKKKRTLVTLARFAPFTIKRGPGVELRFVVPDKYKPTDIGVLVQEAKKLSKAEREKGKPGFKGFGPTGGGIFAIKDASRLHTRAGKAKRSRR